MEVDNVRTHIVQISQKRKERQSMKSFIICKCINTNRFSKDELRLLLEFYAIEIARLHADNRRIIDELKRTRAVDIYFELI